MRALGGASLYNLPMICWIQGAPASQKATLKAHIKISDEEPVSPPKGIWISLDSLWRCDHERVTCIPPLFFSLPPFFSITPPFLCWKLVFARCLLFWRVAVDYTHSIRTELNKQLWDNWGGNEFSHRREEGADVSCMPAPGPRVRPLLRTAPAPPRLTGTPGSRARCQFRQVCPRMPSCSAWQILLSGGRAIVCVLEKREKVRGVTAQELPNSIFPPHTHN